MDNRQKLDNLKQEYLNMKIPEEGINMMKNSIDRAKMEKRRMSWNRRARVIGLSAAAVIAVAVVLPNTNANIAYAMGNIPVLGSFFRVVTFRDYHYEDDNYSAQVEVPKVTLNQDELADGGEKEAQLNDSVQKINLDIEKITQELIDNFEKQMSEQQEGHLALDIEPSVVTDNDRWFTLRLSVLETQASSYNYNKFYTVDKQTGEIISLGGLFRDGSYIDVISEEIKRQMREQMASGSGTYFLDSTEFPQSESDFNQISAEENFYFNSEGELVIVFDQYEVAPGYMGAPEFTIGENVIGGLLK